MSLLVMKSVAILGTIAAQGMIRDALAVKAYRKTTESIQAHSLLKVPNASQQDIGRGIKIREIVDEAESESAPVRYTLVCNRERGGHFAMTGEYSCN